MTLSLHASIVKALEAQSPEITIIATITNQASDVFGFTGGAQPDADSTSSLVDYVHNIHSLTPLSPKLHPVNRDVQTSSLAMGLADDGVIRTLMQDHYLKNGTLEITFASKWDLGDTAPYWKGVVKDIYPNAGVIEILGEDALGFMGDYFYQGLWMNKHPLELITTLLEGGDVQSGFIDSTALLPATDDKISHIVAGNHWLPGSTVDSDEPGAGGSQDLPDGFEGLMQASANAAERERTGWTGRGIQARPAIRDLAFMLYGSVWADEAGKVTFKKFTGTDALAATWTAEDIVELRQVSAFENMINEVIIDLGSGSTAEAYVHRDTDAQTRYKMNGGTAHLKQARFALRFGSQPVVLSSLIATAVQTSDFDFMESNLSGMSGTRVDDNFRSAGSGTVFGDVSPFTQDSDATISSARKLYLQLGGEIISATGLTFATDNHWRIPDVDKYGEVLGSGTVSYYPVFISLTGVVRGVGGTAKAHDDDANQPDGVYDITAAKRIAELIVARCANGVPELDVVTSIAQYAVQIGDLVSLTDTHFLWWGLDGVDQTNVVKWEVIGKEVDLLGDPTRIRWRLAFASIATPEWTTTVEDHPVDPDYGEGGVGIPAAGATVNDTQTIGPDGWVQVDLPVNEWSSGPGWDSSAFDYTITATGIYQVAGQVKIEALDDQEWMQVSIFVDGASRIEGAKEYNTTGGATDVTASASHPLLYLTRGQVVDLRVYHTSAGNETISGDPEDTFFGIARVG